MKAKKTKGRKVSGVALKPEHVRAMVAAIRESQNKASK